MLQTKYCKNRLLRLKHYIPEHISAKNVPCSSKTVGVVGICVSGGMGKIDSGVNRF